MSSIETYDGLCGIIAPFSSSDLRLRCKFCIGHAGPCSWEKYREKLDIKICGYTGDIGQKTK